MEEKENWIHCHMVTEIAGKPPEYIEEVLKNLSTEKVALNILKLEVGEVNENDIKLAKSSKAKILSFRVKVNPIAQHLAEREKVNVMKFEIIYELVESVRHFIERITKPGIVRKDIGKIKILEVFLRDKNCSYCGKRMIFPYNINNRKNSATIEHLNFDGPFYWKDGLKIEDIVIVCGSCNSSRGIKPLPVWFKTPYCKERNINEKTVSTPAKKYLERKAL